MSLGELLTSWTGERSGATVFYRVCILGPPINYNVKGQDSVSIMQGMKTMCVSLGKKKMTFDLIGQKIGPKMQN